jgi:hypothetical protein
MRKSLEALIKEFVRRKLICEVSQKCYIIENSNGIELTEVLYCVKK